MQVKNHDVAGLLAPPDRFLLSLDSGKIRPHYLLTIMFMLAIIVVEITVTIRNKQRHAMLKTHWQVKKKS